MPLLSGAALVQSGTQSDIFWTSLSRLIGWVYTIAWTISFWPQAILIYKRKSVAGVSLEFLSLNFLGFICYSIFNVAFLTSSKIQQQYRNTHNGNENLVRWNDAAFALHAAIMAAWQYGCIFVFKRAPGQHVAIWAKALLGVGIATLVVAFAACLVGGGDDDSIIRWLDFVNICSYVKLVITLVKYTPQIILNFKRKSTRGFAIMGITLDFTGGVFSLIQLFIDAQLINHDWNGVKGDPGKLGLAFISIIFDVVLLTQHYIIFGNVPVEEEGEEGEESLGERRPLLGS